MVTMGKILSPEVKATGLIDVLGMGVSKQLTERMLTPFIGNASIKSALIKGVIGGVLYGKAGKFGNMAAGGLVIDAAEDAAVVLLSMFTGGMGGAEPRNEWA